MTMLQKPTLQICPDILTKLNRFCKLQVCTVCDVQIAQPLLLHAMLYLRRELLQGLV